MCMAHFSIINNAQQIISIRIFYLKYNCAKQNQNHKDW